MPRIRPPRAGPIGGDPFGQKGAEDANDGKLALLKQGRFYTKAPFTISSGRILACRMFAADCAGRAGAAHAGAEAGELNAFGRSRGFTFGGISKRFAARQPASARLRKPRRST